MQLNCKTFSNNISLSTEFSALIIGNHLKITYKLNIGLIIKAIIFSSRTFKNFIEFSIIIQ